MKLKLCPEFGTINEFIESFVSRYDTTQLKSIKVETLMCGVPESKNNPTVSNSIISTYKRYAIYLGGGCNGKGKQKSTKTSYNVKLLIEVDRKCYPIEYADWYREPCNETKQGWKSSGKVWKFDTPEQALIWVFGRYFFVFLSATKQITENGQHVKNVNANGTWFADQMYSEFRDHRTNLILNGK